MTKAHKNNTKTFKEESYSEQAKSITIEIINLEKAIKANIRQAILEKKKNQKEKRIKNLEDLIERIRNYNP